MGQGLKFRATSARGLGSIPGQGTMIPHAIWRGPPKNGKLEFPGTFFFSSGIYHCKCSIALNKNPSLSQVCEEDGITQLHTLREEHSLTVPS